MKRLLWSDVAPSRDFHAAFVDIRAVRNYVMPPHRHDFHEMLFVLAGRAVHRTPEGQCTMAPHTLILVRPDDAHAIEVPRGQTLRYINLAFPSDLWRSFLAFSQCGSELDAIAAPPFTTAPDELATVLRSGFEDLLRRWHLGDTRRLPLLQLWSAALPLLTRTGPAVSVLPAAAKCLGEAAPEWLRRGLDAMQDAENLRGGVTRLQWLCGVSAGHLSRTLKVHSGQSPNEWVLESKLTRAARLLTTSTLAVEEIARDCGFGNSAYFYRSFARRFGTSPRAFRLAARRQVAP